MLKILSSFQKNACLIFLALLAKSTLVSSAPAGQNNPGLIIQNSTCNFDDDWSTNGSGPSKAGKYTSSVTHEWKKLFSGSVKSAELYYSYLNFKPIKSSVLFHFHLRI